MFVCHAKYSLILAWPLSCALQKDHVEQIIVYNLCMSSGLCAKDVIALVKFLNGSEFMERTSFSACHLFF